MKYNIEIRPRAMKDLRRIGGDNAVRILKGIRAMEDDLAGDVKRLTKFEIGYRLRVGEYRVLFDIEKSNAIIRRIKHRREAY